MKRDSATNRTAGIVRARDKLLEYSPADRVLVALPADFVPSRLFPLAVGFLGDFAAEKVSSFAQIRTGTDTSIDDVAFSAKTFLAYANARIDEDLRDELVLLSASAFHLIDMPGVSLVQASHLARARAAESYLERVLVWLLIKPWAVEPPATNELLEVGNVVRALRRHYRLGASRQEMADLLSRLREISYSTYEDRALLIADILSAVVVCRFESSSRLLLQKFSRTDADAWAGYLRADSAIHELWPSQRKLGEAGVLAGASAIVQMPTSAGKTKATEIILRTAFTSGRATLAVVVAPFVALCDEIHDSLRVALTIDRVKVNRLGDALQVDYSSSQWEEPRADDSEPNPHVLVVTPEKLLYVLRQRPEVASFIDLVIYDEGHQFDSGARGVTYELLLTSIKSRLRRSAQTVLISAVIQNAGTVSEWLLGSKSRVVVDTSSQTQRSIGFTSKQSNGQIHFISNSDSEPAFAVPGVMVAEKLRTRPREKDRFFPVHSDSKSVALYLGLRLIENGGVAIFCGKKDSASKLLHYALEVFSRDLSMPPPSRFCDEAELARFVELYEQNFGASSYLTEGAKLGLFSHTSATPRGLRTAIEHAMRERSISFVVCTSTLAQGVNLPIKYLLVAGTYQGREPIRVRDFKNLMGRAGRAGMHEEGAVIFCETGLYDDKGKFGGLKKWQAANELISPESQDPVGSSLLELVLPFRDKFGGRVASLSAVDIGLYLLTNVDSLEELMRSLKADFSKYKLEDGDFRSQLSGRLELLKRLQSHIMASADDVSQSGGLRPAALAEQTLAYHLATEGERAELRRLFEGVSATVSAAVPDAVTQIRYGKSLLGVLVSKRIDLWVEEALDDLLACADQSSLARKLWPLLLSSVVPHRLYFCEPAEALEELFHSWLAGQPYSNLFAGLSAHASSYRWGEKQRRRYDIDDVVDLCESLFGFEIPLVLAAVKTSVLNHGGDFPGTRRHSYLIDSLQKRVKYGVPNNNCVSLFEAGFSDRVVAQRIEAQIWGRLTDMESMETAIRDRQADVEDVLEDFPNYFRSVFLGIIAE